MAMVSSVIGIAQHQRVFELPLLVGGGEFVELLAGVVALAVIELRRKRPSA